MTDAFPSEPLLEIDDPLHDRYASLNLIHWWDQTRLQQAKVMVVGVGALGNEVLKNLALLGVGHLFIVDCDTIEASNLSRSILFRAEDREKRKVEVAAARIREINPDVKVATFHGDAVQDLGLGVYCRMDLVLGCLDNREARLAVNQACSQLGVPWIDGGLDILMGVMRVFVPPEGACYECLMTDEDYQAVNLRYSCPQIPAAAIAQGRFPTTPTNASIIGALQVQEAVKWLHGLEGLAGKGFYFDGQTYTTSLITYTRRQDCPSHERLQTVISLPSATADLSIAQLFELVTAECGDQVVLRLRRELVRTLFCPRCQISETINRPFEAVIPDRIACPACLENRIPQVVAAIHRDSALDALPLRQLGIPPLQIVEIETPERSHFFELTKDEADLFQCWNS